MLAAQKKIKSLKKKIKLLKLFKIERPFPNESPSKAGYLAIKQLMGQHCCRQMLHSVQKATTKGVKKAISPANEWRCLWVCVCEPRCGLVCVYTLLSPLSLTTPSAPGCLCLCVPVSPCQDLSPSWRANKNVFMFGPVNRFIQPAPSPPYLFSVLYMFVCVCRSILLN